MSRARRRASAVVRPGFVRRRVAAVVAVALIVAYAVIEHSGGAATPTKLQTPDLQAIPVPRYAPAIPAHGAYFGAWVRQGAYTQPNQIAALDNLQGDLGRRLDIVHNYLKWQGKFPTASERVAISQGSTLLLSWAGTDSTPSAPAGTTASSASAPERSRPPASRSSSSGAGKWTGRICAPSSGRLLSSSPRGSTSGPSLPSSMSATSRGRGARQPRVPARRQCRGILPGQ